MDGEASSPSQFAPSPREKCPNPSARNTARERRFPVFEPDEGDEFYEIVAGGDSGQLT
jgi:hypothetical protein